MKSSKYYQNNHCLLIREIVIGCFSFLDYFQVVVMRKVCSEWKRTSEEMIIRKGIRNGCVVLRNSFRRWLAESILADYNNKLFPLSFSKVVPTQTDEAEIIDQTLNVDSEYYKMMKETACIFGDVEQLQKSTSHHQLILEEKPKSTILNFLVSLLGYSKHNSEEEEGHTDLQEEKMIDFVKITMFGSEISPIYNCVTMGGTQSNRCLVGCDLSLVNYHLLNSFSCYKYRIFANAGSDKFLGVSKVFFKGSQFVILVFDSKYSLDYLGLLKPMLSANMELIFVQAKRSYSEPVQKDIVEDFIYSKFGEGVYLEVNVEKPHTICAILKYATLLSDILMGLNMKEIN